MIDINQEKKYADKGKFATQVDSDGLALIIFQLKSTTAIEVDFHPVIL